MNFNKSTSFILLIIVFLSIGCDDNSIKPENENQRPVIFSLTVFPDVIGPQDSAIIICNAFDPDGDTLVYDWITDGKSKIKGTIFDELFLYNTFENYRVVYPKNLNNVPIDTLWIQCFARDQKGMSDNGLVRIILLQE